MGGKITETGSYSAPAGAAAIAGFTSGLPANGVSPGYTPGKMLAQKVRVSTLHLPAATPSGNIALTATRVSRAPDLNPMLTDAEWRKAGAFCLPASDANFSGYPSTTTPSASAYGTCGYALWSPQALFLAFVVTDPTPYYAVTDTPWENTGLELYFGVGGQNEQFDNPLGLLVNGTKTGPATPIPGATMTAALTDKGYIEVFSVPWSALQTQPRAGEVIPFNIQSDNAASDGSNDFFYYGNGTKPSGAAISTFGSLTLG